MLKSGLGLLTSICAVAALNSLMCVPAHAESTEAASEQTSEKAAEAAKEAKHPSIEEMCKHRRTLRDDLMLPSLKGMRGIVWGIPGHRPDVNLDQVIENGLKQLPIPVKKYQELESGVSKPVDGFLQVKVLAAGARFSLVELSLTQWTALARDPEISVRAITYTDQAVTNHGLIKDTVTRMINQFVIDYLRANGKSEMTDKAEASSSDKVDKVEKAEKSEKTQKKEKKTKKS